MKKNHLCVSLAALSLVAYSGTAFANPSVQVTTGNWSNTGTWSTGAVPLGSSGPGIGNNSTITFQEGDSYTGGGWTQGLLIGYDSWGSNWALANPGSGTLNVTGGTMSTGYLGLGAGLNGGPETGTLNISGGNVTADQDMLLGWSSTPGSSINVSGGTFNMAGAATTYNIGQGAAATLNVSGGTVNMNRTVNILNGSSVNVSGTGVMNINAYFTTGGAVNVSGGTLNFQRADGSHLGLSTTAVMTLSGGQVNAVTDLYLGLAGNGTINQSGGTFSTGTQQFSLGVAGGTGTYNLSGGNFTGGGLNIYNGALSVQNGTLETSSPIVVGYGGTATGSISGGTLKNGYLEASNFIVGLNGGTDGGTGNFTQSAGAVDIGSAANVVFGWSGTGTYNMNGGTYNAAGTTYVGLFAGGVGTLNINGGSFTTGALEISAGGATSGTVNVAGPLTVTGVLSIQSGGLLKFNGGSVSANGGSGYILNSGTMDVNGQTIAAASYEASPFWAPNAKLMNSSTNAATILGAGNKNTVWINAAGAVIETVGNLTIGSIVTDGGSNNGFTKTGNGTLFLTNPGNDYNGETIINEGTLSIANAVLADAADVRLATGATLNLNFDATDAIDEFFINNVKQANGTWGSTLSSATHKTSQITGGGTLTVGGTVTPTTPTITTAPTATAITVGQTLASSILSGGVASVPGTFAFTTPSTAPAVGTASQPVTFTPNDTVSYTTATTTASVTVYASYANAFGTNSPTAIGANGLANLVNYAFGANSPGAAVTLPASALTADALSLTATVRTNDPTVTTVGESGTNLVLWSPTIIPGLPTQDQTGATPGETQRQIFSAPRGTNSKLFLLLEAIQSN